MARINNLVNFLTDIANAIRGKTGKSETIQPEDMDTEIASISTTPNLQSKSVEITTNTTTNITADSGYDGLDSVAVTTSVSGADLSDYFMSSITAAYSGEGANLAQMIKSIPEGTIISGASANYLFRRCSNLVSVPNLDTSNITSMNTMFADCTSLITAPELDTSKSTNMNSMYIRCTNLVNVPPYDFKNTTNMGYLFEHCDNLSNSSLNNIMATCISVTKTLSHQKTLKALGLSQAQAEICQTLSNYDAFVAAGWTTGY